MKLLIKYCLLAGLLVFISCDSGKRSVHDDANFPKKIDPTQLKNQAEELADGSTLFETPAVTEEKRRIDYINPKANKDEDKAEAEAEEVEEEFNIRNHLPNQNITISFNDVDLASAFYALASLVDRNIVIDDSVVGRISIELYNEPWDIAVLTIEKLKDLKIHVVTETGMLQVFSSARYASLQPPAIVEEVFAEAAAEEEKIEYSTAIFNIFYNEVEEIKTALESFLTDDELALVQVLQPNEATKTLVATADDDVLDRMEMLLDEIDRKVKQVYFELFIVSATDDFAFKFGSRLGLYTTGGGTTVGNKNININKATGIIGGAATSASDIDLGDAAGSVFSGLIGGTSGIGLIADVGIARFKSELDLLESDKVITKISNPKILLSNGKTGVFKQSVQYTILTQPTEGEPEQITGEAGLILSLTPYVGIDDQIRLKYYIEKSDLLPADPGAVPSKDITSIGDAEAPIEMFMKNREIMVLGGLYKSTAQDYSTGIPGTRGTPVLKWLAGNEDMQDLQTELLFFIIPTIL